MRSRIVSAIIGVGWFALGSAFLYGDPDGRTESAAKCGGARISCGETLRVCRNVLCSDHACCLPHSAKQDGLRCVPFLFRRVEIAIRALSRCRRGYLPLAGSLWVCAFLYGDPDGSTTGVRLYEKKRRIGWALLSLWIYDSS